MSSSKLPCLSVQEEDYLKRNENFANTHSYVADCIFLIIFVIIIISCIRLVLKSPESFTLSNKFACVLSFCFIIYISIHLSIKTKVETLKTKKHKC